MVRTNIALCFIIIRGKSTLTTTENVHFAEISATMPYKSYEETCHSKAFNL